MVCGVFPGDLYSSPSAMDRLDITRYRPGYGVYGGTAGCHIVAGSRCLSVFFTLGEPTSSIVCRPRQCLSRIGKLPGLFRGAASYHVCSPDIPERPALSIPVDT